jgi:hypothetical protein
LKKAILHSHLIKTTQILKIYKGRHIFSHLSMPGTLLDCGSLFTTCPGGGGAGYVVVVTQDMWWWWRRICGGGNQK